MLEILYGNRIVTIVVMSLLLTLAACGTSGGTTQSTSTSTPSTRMTTTPTGDAPTQVVTTPTASKSVTATATSAPQNNPSNGPSIILTPTPVPGGGPGSQQVTFPDRILVIEHVSQLSGVGNSTPVSLVLTVKNTSSKPILNQATFFQLVGSEGDAFGYQSSVTPGFYGSILPQSAHNGTIVFLVPTGAMSGGLRLLYRSEIDSETVFVRLQIS